VKTTISTTRWVKHDVIAALIVCMYCFISYVLVYSSNAILPALWPTFECSWFT